MRVRRLCTAILFVLVVAMVGSRLSTADNRPPSLEERVGSLQDMMLKRPVVQMNLERWKTYVQATPKNYSMVVLFTVLSSSMNCPICKPVHEEFLIVANSYRYAYLHAKNLYFAVVDYEEAPQIFQQLGLNTAPAVYHFPAKGGRKNHDQMDFQRMGIDADAIAKFIHDRTGAHIRVLRPPSYAAPAVAALLVMLVLGLLYMRRSNLDFLWNRTFWGIVCMCIVLAFMSGQMWNHIRGPPFIMTNPHTRETSFVHGSTQFQLIAETYIVFALYGAVSIGMILLNEAASNKLEPGKRKLLTCVGLGMVVLFFSLLLSVFRSKYHGYPYHFLFS